MQMCMNTNTDRNKERERQRERQTERERERERETQRQREREKQTGKLKKEISRLGLELETCEKIWQINSLKILYIDIYIFIFTYFFKAFNLPNGPFLLTSAATLRFSGDPSRGFVIRSGAHWRGGYRSWGSG